MRTVLASAREISFAGLVTAKINPAPPSVAGSDALPVESLRVKVAADCAHGWR
jgi:hypothetical protein